MATPSEFGGFQEPPRFGKQVTRFGNVNTILSDHQRMIIVINNVSNEEDNIARIL